MYKRKHLESTFIEIINQQKNNFRLSTGVNEFSNDHFSYLSVNLLAKKSKNVILMGDFNEDLMKYKNDSTTLDDTADFLDLVHSSSLVP